MMKNDILHIVTMTRTPSAAVAVWIAVVLAQDQWKIILKPTMKI
jgi:hypothetical protein